MNFSSPYYLLTCCALSINFTLETSGQTINSLDLPIGIRNGVHEFNIFRKSAILLTDNILFHLLPHKLAAFNSFIPRSISTPLSPSDFHKEVETIKHLTKLNSINIDFQNLDPVSYTHLTLPTIYSV